MVEYGDKLDCRSCDDTLKAERGHDKDGILPFIVDGKRVLRCPLTFITPVSLEYLRAFSFFEKGFLPNGTAWMNESRKFIQAMMILENLFNKQRTKEPNARNRPKHITKVN